MQALSKISDRQLEIIEAAGKLLTLSGVSGLTIKNLAKEMGFSEAALYRHFVSKEEIIVTMLKYLAGNMEERLASVYQAGEEPTEKFRKLFESHMDFFKKQPHFVVAVFSDGLMEESESINEAISQIMRVNVKHLAPIIQEGQKKGTFTRSVSAEEILDIVMGTFRLQVLKWRLSGFRFDLKKSGTKSIQAVLTLITNKHL